MDWTAGLVVALVGAAVAVFGMWRGEWLQDEHGRWDANAYHAVLVALAGVAGFAAGAGAGVLAGTAIVVAGLNVLLAVLVAWGLSGGDGEPDSPIAGVLAIVVFFGSILAVVIAIRARDGATFTHIALMAVPALATVLALFFVERDGEVAALLKVTAVLAVPAALHAVSAALG